MTVKNRKMYDYAAVVDKINDQYYYKAGYRQQIFKYLAKEEEKRGSRDKSATWNMLANLVNDETAFKGHIIQFLLEELDESQDEALRAGIATVFTFKKSACEEAWNELVFFFQTLLFLCFVILVWWMYSVQK